MRLRSGEKLGGTFLANRNLPFEKTSSQNNRGARPARTELRDQRRYGVGRRGDDGEIGSSRQACDVGKGLDAVHSFRLWIDRDDRAAETCME